MLLWSSIQVCLAYASFAFKDLKPAENLLKTIDLNRDYAKIGSATVTLDGDVAEIEDSREGGIMMCFREGQLLCPFREEDSKYQVKLEDGDLFVWTLYESQCKNFQRKVFPQDSPRLQLIDVNLKEAYTFRAVKAERYNIMSRISNRLLGRKNCYLVIFIPFLFFLLF